MAALVRRLARLARADGDDASPPGAALFSRLPATVSALLLIGDIRHIG